MEQLFSKSRFIKTMQMYLDTLESHTCIDKKFVFYNRHDHSLNIMIHFNLKRLLDLDQLHYNTIMNTLCWEYEKEIHKMFKVWPKIDFAITESY